MSICGILRPLTDNKNCIEIVKSIEKAKNIYVYHCILKHIGNMVFLIMLYVSANKSEWEAENIALNFGSIYVYSTSLNFENEYTEKEVIIISSGNILKEFFNLTDTHLDLYIETELYIKILNENYNQVYFTKSQEKEINKYLPKMSKINNDLKILKATFIKDNTERKCVFNVLKEKRYAVKLQKFLKQIYKQCENGIEDNYFVYENLSVENIIKTFDLMEQSIITVINNMEKMNYRDELNDLVFNINQLLKRLQKLFEIYAEYLVRIGQYYYFRDIMDIICEIDNILNSLHNTFLKIRR